MQGVVFVLELIVLCAFYLMITPKAFYYCNCVVSRVVMK